MEGMNEPMERFQIMLEVWRRERYVKGGEYHA